MKHLKTFFYGMNITFTILMQGAPVVQPLIVFFTYVKLGNSLDAATAFTTIALFNVLRFPFGQMPGALTQYNTTSVSAKRIKDFLLADELAGYVKHTTAAAVDSSSESDNKDSGNKNEYVITLTDVSATWLPVPLVPEETLSEPMSIGSDVKPNSIPQSKETEMHVTQSNSEEKETFRSGMTLKNVNVNIKKGEVVAIVGSVGAGKSSFLATVLGELNLIHGDIACVADSIAYCDQQPWIQHATVRDNILFGRPFVEKQFDDAIYSANLEDDLVTLPGGVNTGTVM